MFDNEIKKYQALNELAQCDGIAIMGSEDDLNIPLCELCRAFSIESELYNRSVTGLDVNNAEKIYDTCVRPIMPECIFLHIGKNDIEYFTSSPSEFDEKYRSLIRHIRKSDKKCRIVIVSMKNYDDDASILEMNKHLKYIALQEHCEYGDIAARRLWNPVGIRETISFIHSMGFVSSLKNRRPTYDLIKILFCYEPCLD